MTPQILCATSAALALILLGSCASNESNPSQMRTKDGRNIEVAGPTEIEPYSAIQMEDRAIGFALAELDDSIQKWNSLVLTGNAAKDGQRVQYLEEAIRYRARREFPKLKDQVSTGPSINRQIAATALGFTDSSEALAPLLQAVLDPDPDVVANALLGLSILGHPETPAQNIAGLMSDRSLPDNVRINAGRALRSIRVHRLAGKERETVRDAARSALGDEVATVTMNSALLLAELGDQASIGAIAERLKHPAGSVARASSRAIAYLGSLEAESKGRAVRALVSSLPHVDSRAVRPHVYTDLQQLAGKNYGDDDELWIKYANSLP